MAFDNGTVEAKKANELIRKDEVVRALNRLGVKEDVISEISRIAPATPSLEKIKGLASKMWRAAEEGDTHYLQYLVNLGADVNTKYNDRNTLLHAAIEHCNPETAKFLIENGADVNASTCSGWTPLLAASSGHIGIEIIELLISKKADVNAKETFNVTPLHMASMYGRTDVCRILIDNGADVNAKDSKDLRDKKKGDRTPFDCAINEGTAKLLKTAMEKPKKE